MRPLLLDLFCGAGGAAMGYHRAGFDVMGVDHKPQPHYPFQFVQADALTPPMALSRFDAIHASPPCQAFTALRHMWNAREHPDLIDPCRKLLEESGKPYVIENVPQSPTHAAVILCGTMFRLGVGDAELWRHRRFETNIELGLVPPCEHYTRRRVIGVYGGHGRDHRRGKARVVRVHGHSGGSSTRDGTQQFSVAERREAMGIDWMTGAELSEAIPPAYTEFIGRQLMESLTAAEVAHA